MSVPLLLIEIAIQMPLFSKARPRVTSKGTFMPKEYKEKQKEMRRQIQEKYSGEPLTGPLRVEIELKGEGRGDIDNIIGALFDTANKILWTDDRVSVITEVSASWSKRKKDQSSWLVKVYELTDNSAHGPALI